MADLEQNSFYIHNRELVDALAKSQINEVIAIIDTKICALEKAIETTDKRRDGLYNEYIKLQDLSTKLTRDLEAIKAAKVVFTEE